MLVEFSAPEKPLGALMPSSAQAWLHGWRSPVRGRRGGGAVHVVLRHLSRHVAEPERVAKHSPGLRVHGRGAPRRAATHGGGPCRAPAPGSAPVRPVRRRAPPPRALW